jgi:hypothetical protein
VAGLAVVTALLLSAGHPQPVYLLAWLAALWAVVRAADRRAWLRLGHVLGGAALGAGVAAVQLLPTLDLSARSASTAGQDLAQIGAPAWSVGARVLPGTLFGDVFALNHTFTATTHEAVTFVGAGGALLAAIGLGTVLVRRRPDDPAGSGVRWATLGAALAALAGIVFGLGPRFLPYRAAFRVVPLFDLARVPARWTLLFVLGTGVLVAVGVDALARGRLPRRLVGVVAVATAVVGAVVAFGPFRLPSGGGPWMWLLFAALLVAALLLGSRPRRPRGRHFPGSRTTTRVPSEWRPRLAALAVAAVLAAELGLLQVHAVGRGLLTRQPFTAWRSPFAAELAGGGRALALTRDELGNLPYLGQSLRPNANVYQGIRSIDGYDGGVQVTKRWAEAMAPLGGGPAFDAELTLRSQVRLPLEPAALARFGVRDVLLDTTLAPAERAVPGWLGPVARDGQLEVWRNPAYSGEAWLSEAWETRPAADVQAALRAPEAPPVPLVESGCDCAPVVHGGDPSRRAVDVVRSARSQRIDVESPAPTVSAALLGTDEQWDPGWRVRVDGRRASTVVVDRFFLGAEVPPGAHRVTFAYAPVHGRLGLAVTTVSLLVVVALTLGRRPARFRRRRPASPGPQTAPTERVDGPAAEVGATAPADASVAPSAVPP